MKVETDDLVYIINEIRLTNENYKNRFITGIHKTMYEYKKSSQSFATCNIINTYIYKIS